jgi:hypothetical protein
MACVGRWRQWAPLRPGPGCAPGGGPLGSAVGTIIRTMCGVGPGQADFASERACSQARLAALDAEPLRVIPTHVPWKLRDI